MHRSQKLAGNGNQGYSDEKRLVNAGVDGKARLPSLLRARKMLTDTGIGRYGVSWLDCALTSGGTVIKVQRIVVPETRQDRERLSRQNIVTTLRLRIKTLEERNRELTKLLERTYGVIAKS
jgi:hypothetical protein